MESDLSILRDKKNQFNARLLDFSLEAKMQAKQFKVLGSVAWYYAKDFHNQEELRMDVDSDEDDEDEEDF